MGRTTFYNAINPLHIICKILGLISFQITDRGYRTSKIGIVYVVTLIIIYIVLVINAVIDRVAFKLSDLLTTVDIMQISSSSVQVIVSWTISVLYQSKFISFLTRMANLDAKFLQLGVWIYDEKIYKNIKIRFIVHFIFTTVSFVAQILMYDYAFYLQLGTFNITYYFPVFINMGIIELMSAYNNIIKSRFIILNQHLNNLQNENNDNMEKEKISSVKLTNVLGSKLSILRIICPIHHELTKITKLVNETFGIMVLMSFTVGFVTIIVSLYFCSVILQNFEENTMRYVCAALVMCFNYIFDCLCLCYHCHSTVEAANEAGRLLHQIDTVDEDVQDQIEMFSLQIVNEGLEFSAAGFFPVNYSLVFSIIGGITTYLVILIQFSRNSNE